MAEFGITAQGFAIKTVDVLLDEAAQRARAMFGSDIDLRSSSTLRQVLNLAVFGQGELWKQAERQFYAGFVATANGEALDLLGDGLAVPRLGIRRFLYAERFAGSFVNSDFHATPLLGSFSRKYSMYSPKVDKMSASDSPNISSV